MRISDWSSDVCSSDLGASRLPAGGGSDIEPLVKAGVPVVDLQQDGTRYFDIHHTPDDTLDQIDPAQLRQNVAAWAVALFEIATAPESLGVNCTFILDNCLSRDYVASHTQKSIDLCRAHVRSAELRVGHESDRK